MKIFTLAGIMVFTLTVSNFEHAYCQTTVKSTKLEKQASKNLKAEEWYLALPLYVELSRSEPNNADYAFTAGTCFFQTDNKAEGLKYFLRASELGHKSDLLDFYLGRAYHFNLLFDSALIYYKKYSDKPFMGKNEPAFGRPSLEDVHLYIKNCHFGKLLMNNPVKLKIENIGSIVNTEFPEYAPVISADEKLLMFTTRRKTNTRAGLNKEGRYYESIFSSRKNEKDEWTPPVHMGGNITTKYDDACIGMSHDGSKLLFFNGLNGGDIYVSSFNNGVWGKPVKQEGDINSPYWEGSASFTSDEKIIYFSSDRPGGYGGSDIYYSEKLPNGKWGKAVNLGATINTAGDEDAPQIHVNGKTLFFSSKGHDGVGGFDIFSSTLNLNDSTWSRPKNIGFPINTADDDIYFSMTADGSKGYFTSYRKDGYGEQDIYVVHRPLSSPHHVLLKGKVVDQRQNPLDALISLRNQKEQIIEQVIHTDPTTGSYSFEMSFDKDYNLTVEVEGFFYFTEDINIEMQPDIFEFVIDFTAQDDDKYVVEVYDGSEAASLKNPTDLNNIVSGEELLASHYEPARKTIRETVDNENTEAQEQKPSSSDIANGDVLTKGSKNPLAQHKTLIPLKVGQKMVLNNIYFGFNQASLQFESLTELTNLFNLLNSHEALNVEISGHTDNTGSKAYNQKLSELRAKAVGDHLINKGIDKNRLQVVGYGDSMPVVSNLTPEGRKINRRTELKILGLKQEDNFLKTNQQMVNTNNTSESTVVDQELIPDVALPIKAHFLYNDGLFLTEYSKIRLNTVLEFIKSEKDLKLFITGYEEENEDRTKNLSNERAQTVYNYFINNGIPKDSIEILPSEEKEAPRSAQKGVQGRKVEFLLMQTKH